MYDALEPPESVPDKRISEWVNQVLPKAVLFARSLVRDVHAAEDVVHDCVCKLLSRTEHYDLVNDGFKLLLRSISNAAIDRIRKLEPWSLDDSSPDDRAPYIGVDAKAIDPSSLVIVKELEVAIERGLQSLPVKQRAAIELKGLGLRLAEIADLLSISENHAGVLLHRARATMSIALAEWIKVDEP
jgi:RNA polymerase sigma-70 factor (ECF subfamily)